MDFINILSNGELINCGMFGCAYKFQMNNKFYCIKFNFRKEKINYNEIYTMNLKNINTIPKKYIYHHYDAEIKIQKLLNKIEGEDINHKKLPFTIKIYNNGKIINKKIINKIKDIIYKNFINKNNKKTFINEFISHINNCNIIYYNIMDYKQNILLSNFLYDDIGNVKLKFNQIKELHTYFFYIIYYLYLINNVYTFLHGDLHSSNIILVNDEEYENNKLKYRIIKMNNNYYKIQIFKYRPYIIDFGLSSIFNKNIINQNIIYYNNFFYNNCKIINKSIILNKNKFLLYDLFIELSNIYCVIKYNQINNYIYYCHYNKLKILEILFNYKKESIKTMNLILKKVNQRDDIKKGCNFNFLVYYYSRLTNKSIYNFIKPFQIYNKK